MLTSKRIALCAAIIIVILILLVILRAPVPGLKHRAAKKQAPIIKILSVEGGGLRGVIPLMALQYIEKQAKKPISDLFDVGAGVSSGAITVSILSDGLVNGKAVSVTDLLAMYQKSADEIYHQDSSQTYLLHRNGVNHQQGLIKSLHQILGNVTLASTKLKLIIPAYSTAMLKPQVFNSYAAQEGENINLADVVLASTAVPGIDDPYDVKTLKGTNLGTFVDAATVFSRDPSLIAYVIANQACPNCQFVIADFGTGYSKPANDKDVTDMNNWQFQDWYKHLNYYGVQSIASVAILANQRNILRMLAHTEGSNIIYYHRFNIDIGPKLMNSGLRGQKDTFNKLITFGKKMFSQEHQSLDALIVELNK